MPANENSSNAVLALTVIDGRTLRNGKIVSDTQVLLAVRDPETNLTHQNVISVPTQRIPVDMLDNLRQSTPVEYEDRASATTIFDGEMYSSNIANGHNPLVFAVESILSRKLDLGHHLESNALQFITHFRGLAQGTVTHSNHSENTLMANAVVVVTQGASLMPSTSASYSHIIWTSVKTFIETASQKNPLLLRPDLDPFEYCIHGMCVMSSFNVIAHVLGAPFYPFAIYNKLEDGKDKT